MIPQTAIVTGAGSGIGRETAKLLAQRGYSLSLFSKTFSKLESLKDELPPSSKALLFEGDVRDEDAVLNCVNKTVSEFGRLDILVNNAGIGLLKPVSEMSVSEWDEVMDTNLKGVFLFSKAVLSLMMEQKRGQIINISSGAGKNGIKEMSAYSASKFGVIGFSESLAHEVRNHNIKVSVVLPGSVKTGFQKRLNPENPQNAANPYSLYPEEVANAVLALIEQPEQLWISEMVVRPLNLRVER